MGDFRKNVLQTGFERKNACKYFLGKKYPALKKISLMTYNAEKKSYTVICQGTNFLLQRGLGKNSSNTN